MADLSSLINALKKRKDQFSQTPVGRFASSAVNSFKQAPQELGTAVGKAIVAPLENRRNNINAESDRAVQQALMLRSKRLMKTDINESRAAANKAAEYGERSAARFTDFGKDLRKQQGNAISGTIGTGLTLLGAKGLTPVKSLTAAAVPTAFGGAFAKLTGGDVASGAGAGLGQSLQLAGINKLTNPLLQGAQIGRVKFKGLNPQIAKLPLLKRALLKGGTSGAINTAENELQTRVNEQRGQTPKEMALSFGMGAATGAGGEVLPAAWKAGKQAKVETDTNHKKSALTLDLEDSRKLRAQDSGKQGKQANGWWDKKVELVKSQNGDVLDDRVGKWDVSVTVDGKPVNLRKTAQEILDEHIPLDKVIRPANEAAMKSLRKVKSGGFIDLGATVYGKDAIPKELQPLAEEARKYKTAEEFIKAQGNPILHGSEAKFDNFDLSKRGMNEQDFQSKNAFFFTDSMDTAKSYGKNVQERYGKFRNPLTIDAKGEMYSGGSSNVDMKQVLKDAVEKAKKEGNDVVIVKNLSDRKDWGNYEPATHYAVLDINKLQTKAQLTDLFNKAKQQNPQGGFSDLGAKVEQPVNTLNTTSSIDRTQLAGRQLGVTNAKILEARTKLKGFDPSGRDIDTTLDKLLREPRVEGSSKSPLVSKISQSTDSIESSLPIVHQQEIAESFKANTPQTKVNIVDYLRTPINVLKKIGLGEEGELLKRKYDDYLDELPKEINKVTEWSKRVTAPDASRRLFQYLDGQDVPLDSKEREVATEIQSYLSEWADKLGLPKDKRVAHYITHLFDEDLVKKEFDPELAKLITDKVPGSVYDPFLQERLGAEGYKEDVWQALDAYVKRGVRKFHMDQALGPLKKASEKLDLESQKYVSKLGEKINLRPSEVDNLLDNFIKSTPVGYKFGARPTSVVTRKLRQAVYRGTLGLNVGSALRNLTQGANTYAELGEKYTLKGYMDVFKNVFSKSDELERVGVLRNSQIEDRTINATKKFWEKADKGLFGFFEAAEKINRGSAYFGAKAKYLSQGMSEQEAVEKAVRLVEKTQFRFGSVDTPLALQGDITKFATQFQSFGAKQSEFLLGKISKKEYAGLIRYVGANLVMVATMGKLFGMKPTDMIPFYNVFTEGEVPTPPTIGFAKEVVGAVSDQPDEYGNKRSLGQKAQGIGKSLIPFIPGGNQILNKTLPGLKAASQGYSESKTGRVQYTIPQDVGTAARAGVFGKSQLPQAREYFKEGRSVLGEEQSKLVKETENKPALYSYYVQKRDRSSKEETVKNEIKLYGSTDFTKQEPTVSAEAVASYLRSLPTEERTQAYQKLNVPKDVQKELVEIQRLTKLGISKEDRELMTVPEEVRARLVIQRLQALDKKNRTAKFNALKSVGVVTPSVEQVLIQIQKKKS